MTAETQSVPARLLQGLLRIHDAATVGERVWMHKVALDLDISEFHFARLFRATFGLSPHGCYDEARAHNATRLLRMGVPEGEVARRICFRRPAELRAFLAKRGAS